MRYISLLSATTVSALLSAGGCVIEDRGDLTGIGTSDSTGSTGSAPGCGDGEIVGPEACDDGNPVDGDDCNSDCQISGSMVWCKAEIGDDGPGGGNHGNAVAIDSQGDAIVVGRAYDSETGDDQAVVVKYASDGRLDWKQVLPGDSYATGVVVRDDDSIVAATGKQLFHLSAAGDILLSGPQAEKFSFHGNGLAISAAGEIGFAADISGLEPRGVLGVLRDDLSVRWSREVEELGAPTAATALSADRGRNWLIGGTVVIKTVDHGDTGIQEITEGFLRKYDADGGLLWSQRVSSPDPNYGFELTALSVGAADEAVTLGYSTNNALLDAAGTVVTTFSGEGLLLEQSAIASGDSAVYGRDLVLAANGDRIMTGMKWPTDDSPMYGFVERYGPSGALGWSFRDALVPTRGAGFSALGEDAAGDLFAAGMQLWGDGPDSRVLVCKIRR